MKPPEGLPAMTDAGDERDEELAAAGQDVEAEAVPGEGSATDPPERAHTDQEQRRHILLRY